MRSTFDLSNSNQQPGTIHVASEYLRTQSCLSVETLNENTVVVKHDNRLTPEEVKSELRLAGLDIDSPETNGFIQSVAKRVR